MIAVILVCLAPAAAIGAAAIAAECMDRGGDQ